MSQQKHRSIRLPPQLEARLDDLQAKTGLSLSHILRQALQEYLDKIQK